MRKIKLLAIALVLALAGFVYALGQGQAPHKACHMDKGGCCAGCCQKEDACCRAGAKQAHRTETACASSCECCKGEDSCCRADKSGKMQMKEGACDMKGEGETCCGDSCCAKEKGKAG